MNKKYKAIILDLDGTLLDTSQSIYKGLDYMLDVMGKEPLPDSEKAQFIGPPLDDTYERILGFHGKDLEEAVAVYRSFSKENGLDLIEKYDGIKELLDYLKENGYLSIVVTMKEDGMAKLVVDKAGYLDYFDLVLGNKDIDSLTKAELLKQSLNQFGIKPEEALLIGDTAVDAEGANKTGIDYYPAMYGFGYNHGEDSEAYPYIKKLQKPEELITILEGDNQ